MSTRLLPDLNLFPGEALKVLVRAQHEQLLWCESEIEHLKMLIAKLRRMQFGRKSEKLARQIEQLELQLDRLSQTQRLRPGNLPARGAVGIADRPITRIEELLPWSISSDADEVST
jgi:hypothetical protein